MKEESRDISEEIGFAQPKISDQITGKWFPDTPVKTGTRWFFRLLSIIVIGRIIFEIVDVITLVTNISK